MQGIYKKPPAPGTITWDNDPAASKARATANCPLPCVRMIGPAGQVVDVATTSGRHVPANQAQLDKMRIVGSKQSKGWVLYDSLADKKREALIADRKEANRLKGEKFAQASMSSEDRMAAAFEQLAEQKWEAQKPE